MPHYISESINLAEKFLRYEPTFKAHIQSIVARSCNSVTFTSFNSPESKVASAKIQDKAALRYFLKKNIAEYCIKFLKDNFNINVETITFSKHMGETGLGYWDQKSSKMQINLNVLNTLTFNTFSFYEKLVAKGVYTLTVDATIRIPKILDIIAKLYEIVKHEAIHAAQSNAEDRSEKGRPRAERTQGVSNTVPLNRRYQKNPISRASIAAWMIAHGNQQDSDRAYHGKQTEIGAFANDYAFQLLDEIGLPDESSAEDLQYFLKSLKQTMGSLMTRTDSRYNGRNNTYLNSPHKVMTTHLNDEGNYDSYQNPYDRKIFRKFYKNVYNNLNAVFQDALTKYKALTNAPIKFD